MRGHEDRAPLGREAFSRLRIQWIPSGSSPFTGSSIMTVVGSPSSAVAMPSRCPMPSENCPARLLGDIVEADEIDQLVDTALRNPVRLRQGEQMVVRRPARMHRARFEERADFVQRCGEVAVVLAVDGHVAGCRRIKAENRAASSSTFPSRSAQKPRDDARLDAERQVVDRALRAVVLGQVLRDDHSVTVSGRRLEASERHLTGVQSGASLRRAAVT